MSVYHQSISFHGRHRHLKGRSETEKKAHTCFGSQEGSLVCFYQLASECGSPTRREHKCVFWLPTRHFSVYFGSKEGSSSCVNQLRGQISVVHQPGWDFGVCFCSQGGSFTQVWHHMEHFRKCLAPWRALLCILSLKQHVLASNRALECVFWHPEKQFILF